MALKMGFKKVVVAPYFLFGGKLIDRIYAYTDKVAAENPDVKFMKAGYLKDQDHVINTFIERIQETIVGPAPALSLMQSFQQRLAKGEVDIHHHHAEFQPDADTSPTHKHGAEAHDQNHGDHSHSHEEKHSHAHDKPHGHSHGHSHAPYKHISHPHGPRTMINENVCCCFMGQFPQWLIDEEKARKAELPGTPSCKKN
jgi:sirohydrochlorin cobaltochelatase